jgi:putative addiction module killer protein
MISVEASDHFTDWLKSLRDKRAAARINIRIDRLRLGYFGDVKPVGDGVAEMRIDHGPGYRVYFLRQGDVAIMLLCGGDKSSQVRDIRKAKALANEWKREWL